MDCTGHGNRVHTRVGEEALVFQRHKELAAGLGDLIEGVCFPEVSAAAGHKGEEPPRGVHDAGARRVPEEDIQSAPREPERDCAQDDKDANRKESPKDYLPRSRLDLSHAMNLSP